MVVSKLLLLTRKKKKRKARRETRETSRDNRNRRGRIGGGEEEMDGAVGEEEMSAL
ncbi:hypothetical protein E3U43_001638, partial [Larimichthys crocea]